eukprot:CAMPEP_0174302178 /NCGR_PEP_ID=MMETSP0809-20121228/59479_1 /TAXON_ID=73025 ORGANISM="Eutreptiella gymnastica-like, Strain CCMP1594" /NCGR_SAMPLE_ID=MMETSP0809 /ASSEMBLY_ACC=CAM_ASM_000658 /LENGTH=70 /DNA_ID=CAMNT_0015408055 /DNA_START=2500 /DNA_END=2712 /DNA_ORIENTATION=+
MAQGPEGPVPTPRWELRPRGKNAHASAQEAGGGAREWPCKTTGPSITEASHMGARAGHREGLKFPGRDHA